MKINYQYLFLLLISATINSSCEFKKQYQFGEAVDTLNAMTVQELIKNAPDENGNVKGVISAVCQGEGCWIKLENGSDYQIYIDWDKKFFVPRDIEGKTVFVHGNSYFDTTSIPELKQRQRDKGRPNEEIMLIDSPEIKVAFKADGLIIK